MDEVDIAAVVQDDVAPLVEDEHVDVNDDELMLVEPNSDDEGIVEDGVGDAIVEGENGDIPHLYTVVTMDVDNIESVLYCKQISYVLIKYGELPLQEAKLCISCYHRYLTTAFDYFGVTHQAHRHVDVHKQAPGDPVQDDIRCYSCRDRLVSRRLVSACCHCNILPPISY